MYTGKVHNTRDYRSVCGEQVGKSLLKRLQTRYPLQKNNEDRSSKAASYVREDGSKLYNSKLAERLFLRKSKAEKQNELAQAKQTLASLTRLLSEPTSFPYTINPDSRNKNESIKSSFVQLFATNGPLNGPALKNKHHKSILRNQHKNPPSDDAFSNALFAKGSVGYFFREALSDFYRNASLFSFLFSPQKWVVKTFYSKIFLLYAAKFPNRFLLSNGVQNV